MKPQDIVFILALAVLIWRRDPRYFVVVGLVCIVSSIPLFYLWIFFTAERLVWYAAFCFFIANILLWRKHKK